MRLLYSIFIGLMKAGFFLGQFFNEKISLGYHGRKQSLKTVRKAFAPDDKVIWMHAASLGEYEQGLPVLEELKKSYPWHKILVTFFSPSGYENVVKKSHPANVIAYLPYDTGKEIQEFVSTFQPEIFFTVKYDYWYNLLSILKEKNTKIFSVSANFYPEQIFFKPYGRWFSKRLSSEVDYFFHQTETSLQLAKSVGITNGMVSGDTRFDRVRQFLTRDNEVVGIKAFKGENLLVVFGSAWEGEIEVAMELAKTEPSTKIIIAPHDLNLIPSLKGNPPPQHAIQRWPLGKILPEIFYSLIVLVCFPSSIFMLMQPWWAAVFTTRVCTIFWRRRYMGSPFCLETGIAKIRRPMPW